MAFGVGQNEGSVPFMRRADIFSSEQKPFRIIPAFGQVSENFSKLSSVVD
jgi:hypothetical protein